MLGDDLTWFITLAELEHVGATADRLHVAQPTLSRMLARLERRLGVRLFDRTGKRLRLNEFGRAYYEHARRARIELDAGARAVADLADPAEGTVRLAFLHSFGSWLVPQLVGDFRRQAGRVAVSLHQDAAGTITRMVLDGDADLAVVSPRPAEPGLGWSGLLRQPLVLAVPAGHRLAGKRQAKLAELAGEEVIAMRHGYGMRRLLDELAAAAGLHPRIAFESSDLVTVTGLVAAGLGVALVPLEDPPPGATPSPAVAKVPLADPGAVREVGLVWAADRPMPEAARRFRAVIEGWAARRSPGAYSLSAVGTGR
ncbi:LysR family transcriptional regulator [Nocardia asteroides]|uniref:LysR family transcriptional regulator n=1 Tax=Nocardia asteroides TaxID=1824 RepID=UPI001E4BA5B6|nr:LysR family transcriptional regulator [Nocardia asteroides]UGT60517.1 LysR family transcriptional regulator [Nocardia asteroides]